VLNKVWRALAVLQQKADARSDASKARRRPQRVVADLERLITRVRNIASPLVLLPDFAPLGKTYTTWFPGLVARSVVLDRMIEDMLARLDNPDIRRFRVTDVLAGMDLPDGPTPDGGHYTPPVHRAVARAMAAEILEWASTQPHLALPVPGGDAAVNGQRLADGRHRDLSGA
jgi:hypothetical protein